MVKYKVHELLLINSDKLAVKGLKHKLHYPLSTDIAI